MEQYLNCFSSFDTYDKNKKKICPKNVAIIVSIVSFILLFLGSILTYLHQKLQHEQNPSAYKIEHGKKPELSKYLLFGFIAGIMCSLILFFSILYFINLSINK